MDRIFYRSDSLDPSTGLPIFIFDTSYLPSTDLIDYDAFIPTMMQYIPNEPYVLVMFNCGLNKISWVWGIKFLKQFLDSEQYADNLSKLLKMYTVHDSWFVKSITQIFNTKKNLVSLQKLIDTFSIQDIHQAASQLSQSATRDHTPIIRCSNLSELSNFIDITKLKISLNIYKHNLQLEQEIQSRSTLFDSAAVTGPSLGNPIFYHHFYQIFNILNTYSNKVQLIFHKPGNKLNTEILYQCINRDQLIWINDWDLWCIGACFKKILTDLPRPLISIELIQLPMNDTVEFTSQNFMRILSNLQGNDNDQLLFQFFQLCHKILENPQTTQHTTISLSRCISHALSHEIILLNKDRISVVNRFVKNVLDHWPAINQKFNGKYLTIDEVINGKKIEAELENKTQNFTSYDISYDLTIDNDEEDLEYRVAFNTTNILSDENLKRKESEIPQQAMRDLSMNTSPMRPSRSSPKGQQLHFQLPQPLNQSQSQNQQHQQLHPQPQPQSQHQHQLQHQTSFSTQISDSSSQGSTPIQRHSRSTSISSINTITPVFGHSSSKSINSINSFTPTTKHSTSKSITSISSLSEPQESPKPIKLTLKDVSNIVAQYPPQKYKFHKTVTTPQNSTFSKQLEPQTIQCPVKKPVIRGRKVGELAKLFEERAEAMEILRTM